MKKINIDKFVWTESDNIKLKPSQCHTCKYWRGTLACDAFPEGIPDAVVFGGVSHKEPIEGDHGIQYEAITIN